MPTQLFLFCATGLILLLLPLVPRILNLRIAVLRALHLYAFADWHQRHYDFLVPALRVLFVFVAAALTFAAIYS